MRLRREAAGLVGALVLHVAVFALMSRLAPPSREASATDHAIDLDVEDVPAPETPSSLAALAAVPSAASEEARPTPAVTRGMARMAERASPIDSSEPPTLSPPEAGSAFTFNPTVPGLTNRALGLDGHNAFLSGFSDRPDGAAPSQAAEANVAPGVDRSMRDAMQALDHSLGFDVGGPLVGIAEELTRPSDAPTDGSAVFEVTLDEAGAVTGVRLIDAGAGRPAWEHLATQMVAAFRSRRVALRTKGRGMIVTMEVSSRWALPSGQAAGRAVSDPYVKPGEGDGTYVAAGGHFDLSDIGSRPHRDVHARILHEQAR
jgi:hypothetical protein